MDNVKFIFQIQFNPPSKRILILQCKTKEEMVDWMGVIQKAVKFWTFRLNQVGPMK